MSLQNQSLRDVQAILLPSLNVEEHPRGAAQEQTQQEHAEEQPQDQALDLDLGQTEEPQKLVAPSRPSNTSVPTTASAEFIPHLFYSLHQIRKHPNNSANHLETSTGFIRHRLKSCKSLVESSEDCKKLLCRTTEEWKEYLVNREKELEVKRKVLLDLGQRISTITENN